MERVPTGPPHPISSRPAALPHLPDIWTTAACAGLDLTVARIPLADAAALPPARALPPGRQFKRTLFTDTQRQILTEWFNLHHANPYPTTSEKELLVKETGLHREQINVWFTNHRIRQGFTAAQRLAAPPAPGFRAPVRI
jgi:hypothetical protein